MSGMTIALVFALAAQLGKKAPAEEKCPTPTVPTLENQVNAVTQRLYYIDHMQGHAGRAMWKSSMCKKLNGQPDSTSEDSEALGRQPNSGGDKSGTAELAAKCLKGPAFEQAVNDCKADAECSQRDMPVFKMATGQLCKQLMIASCPPEWCFNPEYASIYSLGEAAGSGEPSSAAATSWARTATLGIIFTLCALIVLGMVFSTLRASSAQNQGKGGSIASMAEDARML